MKGKSEGSGNLGVEPNYTGDLSALLLETEYRSIKESPAEEFYAKCLRNSCLYERAVGYFSSSVYTVVGPQILEFVRKGGRINLICSPALSLGDIEIISKSYAARERLVEASLKRQFDDLLNNEVTSYSAQILSTLIELNALEIRIATRRDGRGIYHEKLGIFSDTLGNVVSFRGSTNETWSGWHDSGNFETIEVFCSWRDGNDAVRVHKHKSHFNCMWDDEDKDIEVSQFPRSVKEYVTKFSLGDLPNQMPQSKGNNTKRDTREPLDHQKTAIEGWEKQNKRGIFEHATGTGKTFTALIALKSHVSNGMPALVVVPSRLLHKQWQKEISDYIPEATLLLAGAGHSKWKEQGRLGAMLDSSKELGARIVLATMKTASSAKFLSSIGDASTVLLVADEVHQIGSPQNAKCLTIDAAYRLGLSATPARYGDPEGTEKISSYFGGVVPPAISLADAVKMNRLVPYEYFPHPINLSASEAEQWSEYSLRIRNEMARLKKDEKGKLVLNDKVKLLLIQRSRIAKKAVAKTALATEVLKAEYEDGQSWLVYCQDSEQLSEVISDLEDTGLRPIEYHSAMDGDREATLDWFRKFGGILVSINCLDEGVDIPAVSHALILASSQNPRQFIQRRGRVLRKSPGKYLAVIHDAIVVPLKSDGEQNQVSLLKSELARSLEFAENAVNRSASAELREIAIETHIDFGDLVSIEEIEEDD